MADQPRAKTYGESAFFADRAAARPLVAGTVTTDGVANEVGRVPWSQPVPDTAAFPRPLTMADLQRGKQLFTIYCVPCHGSTGEGDGMIVYRGFSRPPSYHEDRLRNAAAGHFYNVITNGWGAMYSFADRVQTEDRWRIAGYIKALELSQHVPQGEVESPHGDQPGGDHAQ